MSAKSKAQRRLMALAKHHPERLHEKNRGVARMTKKQLGEFASTKEKGLQMRKKKKGKRGR